MTRNALLLSTTLSLTLSTLLPACSSAQEPPRKPDVGKGLKQERELLAGYRWRLRTEMKVDDVIRLTKVEDVHLGPDGGLVKRQVKYEKKAEPTPLPYGDPRNRLGRPATSAEDDRFADQAQDLMQLYARLSPERLDAWAASAELLPAAAAGHPSQIAMHGRGLGRPQDDAMLYLDSVKRTPTELEVKTTVDPQIIDIAFLRVTFESIPAARSSASPLTIPRKIFLNMNRGRRRVTLEMETSDYRSWP